MYGVDLPFVVEGTPDVLLVVIVTVGVFGMLAVGAACVALALHVRHHFRTQHRRRLHDTWRPLLLGGLAGVVSPETLVDEVDAADREAFFALLVPYATAIEGGEEQFIRAVAGPFLGGIRASLAARRPFVRAQTVRRLGLLGGQVYTNDLRDALTDPSPVVAKTAVTWLARRGEPEDATLILRHLDRLAETDRRQLSSVLVELGEEATPAFRDALTDTGRSVFVRVICAETLRWLGDGASADVAASMLEADDLNPELAASLLRLLRRVGRREHASILRAYCTSEVPFVRIHAARALGQVGTQDDEGLLAQLFQEHEDRWVALSAAQSLVELGCTDVIHQLGDSDHPRAALAQGVLPRTV